MFFKKSVQNNAAAFPLSKEYTAEGICFFMGDTEPSDWLSSYEICADADKGTIIFLSRLEEEGAASITGEKLLLSWQSLYALLSDNTEDINTSLLCLPIPAQCIPKLSSKGALSENSFGITISWGGTRKGGILSVDGTEYLLPEAAWQLAESVRNFAMLPEAEKTYRRNEREWSRIRKAALQSEALLDNFLEKTIILTPDKLHMDMRKDETHGAPVVELMPSIEGIDRTVWLNSFDAYDNVQSHYTIALENGGTVSVIIDDAVAETLKEIKSMPGRRVAGKRAQAFLRNPFTILSEAAKEVISEESFLESRAEADINFYSFYHKVIYKDATNIIHAVQLTVYSDTSENPIDHITLFSQPEEFETFIQKVEKNYKKGFICCVWEGYELELKASLAEQLEQMHAIFREWKNPPPVITYQDVFDFTRYVPRVEGIGEWKPTYSVFTAKKDGAIGWIPDNIIIGVTKIADDVQQSTPLDSDGVAEENTAFQHEQLDTGMEKETVTFSGTDDIPWVDDAQTAALLSQIKHSIQKGSPLDLDTTKWEQKKSPRPARIGLNIKQNIEVIDYEEGRNQSLDITFAQELELPTSLKPSVVLQKHQEEGIQWLQHLWRKTGSPDFVRGCIFADDMGLGKTLQLLTFIAWYLENEPAKQPILIVAPVALLHNWQEEMKNFFSSDFANMLLLYGDNVRKLRVDKKHIDSALTEKGMTNFLRPEWIGNADIVLTTYETMRDLEISLSTIKWSIMVCDEAQKIKTPGALVTKAAKAQHALFKVACTGTPVENSLTDLWCLFDFIQPGYLGSLNQFSRTYKRPIEANTDEEKDAVSALRTLIESQIKRRMKKDVASLPKKYDEDLGPFKFGELSLSPFQFNLYAEAVNAYHEKREKAKDDPLSSKVAGTAMLGMLHRLRGICADPRQLGFKFDPTKPINDYCNESAKMEWLLKQLELIRQDQEKVIIFTEFKEIQLVLRHYIKQRFGFQASIVNGDVKVTDTARTESRHKIISRFQDHPGFNVLILSPVAVGFGVNIQAANHVIHYTRCWNPAKEDQATDRAYRIGQKKDVYVYYPTVHSKDFTTFEKKLDMLLREKRKLADSMLTLDNMLNGAADITLGELDVEDIKGNTVIPDVILTAAHLSNIEGKTFEHLCRLLWEKQGFSSHLNTRTPQGGIDIFGWKGTDGFAMQCKTCSSADKALGRLAVTDVVSGYPEFARMFPEIRFKKISITNQYFNYEAQKIAEENEVELLDKDYVLSLLDKYQITLKELQGV